MALSINEKLLEGDVKVVTVGQNKPGLFSKMLIVSAVALGVGLYVTNKSENTISTNAPEVINNLKKSIDDNIIQQKANENIIKNPILGNFISNNDLKNQLEKMGNFDIPSTMKPNQISRYVAQVMFDKAGYTGYTSSLISEREGFKKHLYNDVGWFAIGNGMNLGVNSKQHIQNVLSTVSDDQAYIKGLTDLSGKKVDQIVPENFKSLTITPQKSIQIAMVMSQTFEKSVVSSFSKEVGANKAQQVFDSLKDNEKAALVNIAYQKGRLSTNETKSVVAYAQDKNKTPQKAMQAISVLGITYMLNGTRVSDIRAETLAKTMFASPELFQKVIKDTVKPKDIAEFASIFKGNVTLGDNGKTEINDPIGIQKEKAEREGVVLKLTIAPEIVKPSSGAKATVFFGI